MTGAVLRLWQYLANSSLWIDELALARNILDRPWRALTQPLDYAQVAPAGFLYTEKSLVVLFGTDEYALRLFPLLCGVGSLFLFWGVSKRVLSGWAVPYAVGLFSLGLPFVYFSSQVKQYSSDVAAALLLLLGALDLHRRPMTQPRALRLGLAGALIAWWSQAAVIVMAGIGAATLILAMTGRNLQNVRRLAILWVLWGIAAVAATAHGLRSVTPSDREYFQWFWSSGFMPMPPRTLSELGWLPAKLTWVFGAFGPGLGHTNGGLNYRWSPVFAAMMLYGYWVLWRQQRDTALFLLMPVIAAIALSAASVYPFTARLLAFLIPFLLVATAAGARQFLIGLPARFSFLGTVTLAVLGGAPVYAIATALPPSWVQHMRPIVAHVSEQHQRGDRIYVYSGARLAFGYYASRFRIEGDGVVFGRCSLADPREYFRELDALRGEKRVWIVATHERSGELELILGYLDQLGRRLDAMAVPASNGRAIEDAYAYLYDLSDRQRAASVSAESYALPASYHPPPASVARWGCYGVTGEPPRR